MGDVRIVAGRWGRRRLKVPRGRRVRPTSERAREAWMAALGADLESASVLDLFAGSGALGLEALSRGARHATFVERDVRVLDCLRANIAALGADESATVVAGDVFEYVGKLEPRAFDIALADPPYGAGLVGRLVDEFGRNTFARILSVEHERGERIHLPPRAQQRRYGDTVIAFLFAADLEEEST